jgi:hypothetical protein
MASVEKKITRKIVDSPIGRAITEVVFAVVFTFLPIVLLSIPFSAQSGAITWDGFTDKFEKFWQAGQLSLPILAVCGTIAALAAINGRILPQLLHTLSWLVSVALFLGCGFALASSNGFSEPLNNGILNAGVWVYLLVLVIWITVAVKSEAPERPNPEERANKLVKELHGEEGDAA